MRQPSSRCVLLRHDVDRNPSNAIAMAELEHALGIRSTYYVRKVTSAYSDALVSKLHALGHEVGYHYEVLSKTGGDMHAALTLFAAELKELRHLAPICTASSHGSPLSPWDSLDIWKHSNPTDFGLLGEAYLQIDYSKVAYYTDTGRTWSNDGINLRDRVDSGASEQPGARTTDELLDLISTRQLKTVCIQTHPERWNSRAVGQFRSVLFDWSANCAKRVIRAVRSNHVR